MSNTFKVMRNSAFVLISAFFFACENPTDIRLPGTDNQEETYFTDTLSLELGTYLMDSAITSGQAAALVGSYTDPVLGKITASAYLQPTLPQEANPLTGALSAIPFDILDTQVFDSLVIRLVNRDNLVFGDSTGRMTLNVHRLSASLPSKNYNYDSEVAYEPTPIAAVTFERSDMRTSNDSLPLYLRIRLPDSIGEELKKLEGTETAEDRDAFSNAFRGFVFTSAGANSITSFNLNSLSSNLATSSLVYYVHNQGDTTALSYQFEFTGNRFNRVVAERNGTALAALTAKGNTLKQSETNGNTFLQASAGLATRVKFTGLNSLKNPEIKRAVLEFEADKSTFNKQYPNAPFVTLLEMEGNSIKRVNGDYSYVNNFLGANSGFLTTYVDSTNKFLADVTPYLQDITNRKRTDDGLAIVPAIPTSNPGTAIVFNAGLNRMVLRNFKLNLYYSE